MQRLVFGLRSYLWFEKPVVTCLTLLASVSAVQALARPGLALYEMIASDPHLLALFRKVVLVDFKAVDYPSLVGLAVLIAAVTLASWVIQRGALAPCQMILR